MDAARPGLNEPAKAVGQTTRERGPDQTDGKGDGGGKPVDLAQGLPRMWWLLSPSSIGMVGMGGGGGR